VNFAREHGVKLVVKGTGHDYLGRSNAADSLLVWTHHMREITVHDSFVPAGGSGPGVPAVTAQAGALWLEAYDEVTNKHGRYVQGGGCTSVGVVGGFIQGGGFGSFSKQFGLASAGMLEAEVVLADGTVVVANEYQNEDLFWALRGGGGGTFGVVTRMTLLTHEIPKTFGVFSGSIRAGSDESFRELLEGFVRLYADSLGNERWGEQVKVKGDNSIELSMLFHGLTEAEAREVWKPFLANLESRPQEFKVEINVIIMPAREMWNYKYMADKHSELLTRDERKGQPKGQYWWASNQAEVSRYIYSYQSRWVPQNLFKPAHAKRLAELFFQMSRNHTFSLHFNKGQAGASAEAVERGRKTSINPAVFDAAAQIIMNDGERDAYPDIAAHAPDSGRGQEALRRMNAAMKLLRDATPGAGTYSNEADYHEPDWQEAFWGSNYPRLLSIKRKYDPANFFRTHHSVGSEG